MLKSIIIAAVIATATFTTTASAMTVNECVSVGEIVEVVAKGRDLGINAPEMYTILQDQNLPETMIIQLLNVVYITGEDVNGATLKGAFIGTCVGESA